MVISLLLLLLPSDSASCSQCSDSNQIHPTEAPCPVGQICADATITLFPGSSPGGRRLLSWQSDSLLDAVVYWLIGLAGTNSLSIPAVYASLNATLTSRVPVLCANATYCGPATQTTAPSSLAPNSPHPCFQGHQCDQGASRPEGTASCAAGFYCPQAGVQIRCPSGKRAAYLWSQLDANVLL